MKSLNKRTKSFRTEGLKLLLISAGLILGFQNCGPGFLQTATDLSSQGVGGGGGDTYTEIGGGNMAPVQEKVTVGVNYSENIFTSMLLATGVTNPSQNTLNSARDKKAKIAETGKAESVTAPMWMAVTNLAGDVCLDLVNQEKALQGPSRRMFPLVNFSAGPRTLSAQAKDDAIRRMARSFWGRNETVEEKTLIRTALDEAIASSGNRGNETDGAMLYACTAMLAALEAQIR